MKSTEITQPAAISQAVAANGTRNTIPENATGSNLASIEEGFPDITMKTVSSGGLPPFGQDFNGLFYLATDQRVYLQNGGIITFSDDVSSAIGGYPKGAILDYINEDGDYCKVKSLIDDNTYNFVEDSSYIDDNHWQYVQMHGFDTDFINQSKALETGSVSSNETVYEEVYGYAHSTFDSSKFTVTGDITITDDGIASGFTADETLLKVTFDETITLGADAETDTEDSDSEDTEDTDEETDTESTAYDTLRVKGRAVYSNNSDDTPYPMLFTLLSSSSTLRLIVNNKQQKVYLYYGYTSDTTSGYSTHISDLTLEEGDEFDYDCYWDGSTVTLTVTVDGVQYSVSVDYTGIDTEEITGAVIGSNQNKVYPWGGTIDLKYFVVEKNDVVLFTCNETGTDTYTIDGETIEIPYYLSKTGSKIADYSCIDSVQALYDKYGYAMYYTIDTVNRTFTLPMGEIYGMKAYTDLSNLNDTGVDLIRVVTDGVYNPVNLTEKFADEIANYSSEWTWIQARIQAADYSGIHIGDYMPVTLTGGDIGSDYTITEGQEHKMQVAGIDTYYNSGDTAIGHHIDFISMNTIGEYVLFNGGDSNNGTASEPNPWLASAVYAILNGVDNYTTSAYNSLKHGYDAADTGGVLQMLPDDLQSVIITKRTWAEEQYSSSALVNYPTGYGWKDYGYLWVPHEVEVCGYQPNSYNRGEGSTLDNLTRGLNKMYPLFRYATRVRTSADDNSTRQNWALCVPSGSAATDVCSVADYGGVYNGTATFSTRSVCFGFRIG